MGAGGGRVCVVAGGGRGGMKVAAINIFYLRAKCRCPTFQK